jgi:hypothetical protein
MESNQTQKIVIYYWTNLVCSQQSGSLDQQRIDFKNWLETEVNDKHFATTPEIVTEFIETHLKRTKPKYFPELSKSVDYCLAHACSLVIVRLGGLINQERFANLLATPGLNFVCIDKPLVTPAALSVVRQYVSEQSKQHSASIKRGLKLTKQKLGNPNAARAISPFNKIKTENSVLFALLLQPVVTEYQKQGMSQRSMVDALNEAGILAPEGGKWVLSQLQKVLKRIAANNLALDLTYEVEKNNYQNYSAKDLVTALNIGNFIMPSKITWDENLIAIAQGRNQTIISVLELYEFMQKWGLDINNFVAQGKSLEAIAMELNNRNIAVPQALQS